MRPTASRARATLIAAVGLTALAPLPACALSFLLVSDIHFDPLDPPGLATRLASTAPAEWRSAFAPAESRAMSGYGSDTNHALLESALTAIAREAASADLAIVPGDLISHDFEQRAGKALGVPPSNRRVGDLAVATTVYVAGALADALPGKPVIIALGNNDSECGDYRIIPGGDYLAGTMEIVRRLAGADLVAADFEETYSAGGYYSVRHPTLADTTILVVNDVLWSTDYRDACSTRGAPAAEAMMDWLEAELSRLTRTGGRAWLVHHIPWGMDPYATAAAEDKACTAKAVPLLKEPFASQLLTLVGTHAGVIRASLSGHIHHDSYRLLRSDDSRPLAVDKIAPAISPIFGQNPGFQIFTYDGDTASPTDFSTWYLTNLAEASASPAEGDWRLEYTFTTAYSQPEYSAESVAAIWMAMSQPGSPRDAFRRFYPVDHGELSADVLSAYLCAIGHVDPKSFTACYCGGPSP